METQQVEPVCRLWQTCLSGSCDEWADEVGEKQDEPHSKEEDESRQESQHAQNRVNPLASRPEDEHNPKAISLL